MLDWSQARAAGTVAEARVGRSSLGTPILRRIVGVDEKDWRVAGSVLKRRTDEMLLV